jgi:hypothetical protein
MTKREARLVWWNDGFPGPDQFMGYEAEGESYSSLRTLPRWAQAGAALKVIESRERFEDVPGIASEFDLAVKIQRQGLMCPEPGCTNNLFRREGVCESHYRETLSSKKAS